MTRRTITIEARRNPGMGDDEGDLGVVLSFVRMGAEDCGYFAVKEYDVNVDVRNLVLRSSPDSEPWRLVAWMRFMERAFPGQVREDYSVIGHNVKHIRYS